MRNKIQDVMRRRAAGEKGFTLVELLVVVVILIVLSAIAVPIFLNQKTKAESAAVQSNVGAVSGVIKNGHGVGATVTYASNTVGYTSADAGTQSISDGGATVTNVNNSSTWCVSQANPAGSGATAYWMMDSSDSEPVNSATACS